MLRGLVLYNIVFSCCHFISLIHIHKQEPTLEVSLVTIMPGIDVSSHIQADLVGMLSTYSNSSHLCFQRPHLVT